jgi:hypothetical protein
VKSRLASIMTIVGMLGMLAGITMCSMSALQRPVGPTKQVLGIVESAGPVGKFSAAASVRLANGNIVTIFVPRTPPVSADAQVLLTESVQNFGPAKYEFVRVLP